MNISSISLVGGLKMEIFVNFINLASPENLVWVERLFIVAAAVVLALRYLTTYNFRDEVYRRYHRHLRR